jgi:hypothetical protein
MASTLSFPAYNSLPVFAKVAIERLDGASELRTADSLDFLLDAYARTYGLECDSHTRASSHHICARRFATSFAPYQAGHSAVIANNLSY